MAEYMTLLGSEQVERAARTMSEAASRMESAASSMQDAAFRIERALAEHGAALDRITYPAPTEVGP